MLKERVRQNSYKLAISYFDLIKTITLMKKIPNRHRWEFHVKRKRKKRGKETSEGRN